MGCITKIKELRDSYTQNENMIADYILENKDIVLTCSSSELGDKTNTSAAAIIRFSKKLGYQGFTQLKLDLAQSKSLSSLGDENDVIDNVLSSEDTMTTIMDKSLHSNLNTVETTYQLLKSEDLQKAVNMIEAADTVYLFGVGGSGVVCSDFQYKLMRNGKKVIYWNDAHVALMFATAVTKKDLVIAVSYSGSTKEVLTAVKWAKDAKVPVLAITQYNINPISKLADLSLGVPAEEHELRVGAISSRISSLIIIDLLYYGLIKEDIDHTTEKLLLSRNIIREIK